MLNNTSYLVFFEDGTEWQGGHYSDSKWDKMPDKPIIRIEYSLTKKVLVLEGFEAYGHIVARVDGVNIGFKTIPYVIIMGKWKNNVYQTVYDFQEGKVYTKLVNYGEENQGQKDGSWHKGKWDKNITPKMKPKN